MIYHFPPKASELTTALVLFLWSVIILYIGEDPYVYAVMNNLSVWATLFGILSAVRIAVLYINGALRRSPHLRAILSLLSCFAWFQITLAFLATEQITTGLAVYPVLLALDFYNGYRIAVEARITDESYKNAGSDN